MHVRHARVVMHVGIANPRWRGKRMRNPQFYGKGPVTESLISYFDKNGYGDCKQSTGTL